MRRDPASIDQYVASPFHSQTLEPAAGRMQSSRTSSRGM